MNFIDKQSKRTHQLFQLVGARQALLFKIRKSLAQMQPNQLEEYECIYKCGVYIYNNNYYRRVAENRRGKLCNWGMRERVAHKRSR